MTAAALEERYGALSPDRIAALDAAAVDAGVDILMLMEVAGWQVARCAWRMLHRRRAPVLVLAGRGNNGGDGLVAARHLRAWGCEVEAVVLGEEERLRGAVVDQLRAAGGAGVAVRVTEDTARLADAALAAALCVDALLGTGLRSAPREPDAGAIAALEGARVLSVDVPSGLDAGTGLAHDPCVRAEVTCTLTAVKSGLWTAGGRARAGRVVVADIGMPLTAWTACGLRPPTSVRAGALLTVPAPF